MTLSEFLIRAKTSTYARGDQALKVKELDRSTTLTYTEWEWIYHDNYFWGEPYGGREVVSYEWKPVWIMVYYGWIEDWVDTIWEVYTILQWALRHIPETAPYRWPLSYTEWGYHYFNNYSGGLERFSWREIIVKDGVIVYQAQYMGGSVDR